MSSNDLYKKLMGKYSGSDGSNNQEKPQSSSSGHKQTYQALMEKYNPEVNEDYVNRFIKDANAFVGKYGNDVGYITGRNIYDKNSDTLDDLNTRARILNRYFKENADRYENPDQVTENFASITSALEKYGTYLKGQQDYYSQWDTEDDYNAFLDYDAKSKFDLKKGQKEIDDLESLLEKYKSAKQGADFIPKVEGKTEMESLMDLMDSTEKEISQKKQYLNQARHIQESAKLSSVSKESDFWDLSKYSTTIKESTYWWQGRTEDTQYEWINNKNGFRDDYERDMDTLNEVAAATSQSSFYVAPTKSAYRKKGYDKLTKNEIAIYNYYYAKDGKEKAQEYLDSIQETLNYRKATQMYGELEDQTAQELIFGVEAGLDQFASGVQNLFNTEDDYIPQSAVQMTSGMVREDMVDRGAKLPKWLGGASLGQVGYDAITTSANMAPSILTSMAVGMLNPVAGQITGNVLMGASASGNAYQEALNQGYDKGQARLYSGLIGGSEAVLGQMLGGISKLGGTSQAITNMLNGVDNAFLRFAAKMGGSMISEGFEEGLQEILTPMFENMIMHTDNDINWSEVAYSTLLGALTAGVMEGPGTIAGEVGTYNTGKQLKEAGVTSTRLAEIGSTFAADTVAYQLAGRVNENTGAYTMGRLFNEIGATLTEQNVNDITEALVQEGIPEGIARNKANLMARIVEGAELTEKGIQAIEEDTLMSRVMKTTFVDSNSTWFQRSKGYNEALMALARETAAPKGANTNPAQHGEENAPASDKVDANNKNGAEAVSEADITPAKVNSISAIKNGQVTVKMDDGSEVDITEADLDPEDGVIIETIAKIGGISASDANFILGTLKAAPGVSAQVGALGAKEAYQYGFYGFSDAHMAEHGVFANSLTKSQREAIYKTGREARAKQTAEKQATVSQKESVATSEKSSQVDNKNATVAKSVGKVHFDGDRSSLTKRQSASLTAMEKVADVMGVQIHVFESKVGADGKRIGANGWYDPSDNSIHIDLHAGANGEGTMLFTLAHELTHHIRKWSPAKFKTLADFLMQEYGKKGVNVDVLIREQMAKAKRNGRTISYDTAYEEVVADSMEMMLSDGNVMKRLEKLKAQDKDLWHQIKRFIDDMAAKIRSVYKGMTPDSEEGRYVAEMGEVIYKLQELFADALVDASENYKNTIGSRNMEDFATAQNTDGKPLFQYRAMEADEDTYRHMLKTWGKMSDKQISNLFTTIDRAMDIIKDNLEALDYAWEADIDDRAFSPVKPNSDSLYQVSLDFSTLCRKRILQQTVQAQLQEALKKPLTRDEGIAIRDALMEIQKEGRRIEVACALCYVESARMKSPEQIKRFMENREKVIKDFFASKSGGDIKTKIKQAELDARERLGVGNKPLKQLSGKDATEIRNAKKAAKAAYVATEAEQKTIDIAKNMTVSDFTSPEGLENLAKNHRNLFDAYTSYIRNATKSKGIENDTWWRAGDSMNIGDVLIANMNKENGLRSQSWSDFQVIHILDYIASTIELATRNTKEQAYSKVPDYVELMGQTGVMINMSLIPTADFDGTLRYDSVEGMDYNRALKLRDKYPATAGTICIGVGNKQIQLLLGDITIDYVIPYHRSGMSAHIRKAMHIPTWGEYQDYQSESKLSRAEAQKRAEKYGVKLLDESNPNYQKHTSFSEWFDLKEAQQIAKMENKHPSDKAKQEKYGVMYGGYMAMQNAGNNYLKLCAERGLAPKFSHEKADFTGEDNYWKLLIDRKMVNNVTGEIIEQQNIKPIFDEGEVLRILNDELDRYPKVKADQEYAIRKVTEAYLSGELKAGMSADAIAKVMQKPVDNVSKTNITTAAEHNMELTEADMDEYMRTGVTKHTRDKKERMRESGKKPILTSFDETRAFISDVITGKAAGEVRAFARVGTRLANAIKDKYNALDLAGNYLELNADGLREAYKRHSVAKEKGDIPLSEADFERIPEYMDEFDGVLAVDTFKNRVEIHLYKQTGNGYVRILTVSSKERSSLQVTKLIGVSAEKFEEKYAKKIERDTGSPRGLTENSEASNPSTKARLTAGALSNDIVHQDNTEVKRSDRDIESASSRSLLANALESVAQNDIEKRRLQEYKDKIDIINTEEQLLRSLNEQIKELSFAEGKRDTKKITELRFEAMQAANRINTYDRQLLRLEASKPLQNVLQREKKMAYDRAYQKGKDAMAAYRLKAEVKQSEILRDYREVKAALKQQKSDAATFEKEFIRIAKAYEKLDTKTTAKIGKDTKTIADLKAALKEETKKHRADQKTWETEFNRLLREYEASGRSIDRLQEKIERQKQAAKAKVESREKTAMRQKIQNVVGELNHLLLNNDKKRHVPDSLKKAVADALSLVNMDTVGAEERAAKYANLIAKEQAKAEPDQDKIDAYTVTMENILRKGEKMGQRLKDLRDAYEEIQGSDDPDIANAYDPVIAGCLKELAGSIGDTSLRDMSIEQLSDVYDMYRMVLTRVRDANKTFINEKKESISNLASRVIGEVRRVGGEHKYRASILDPVKKFGWNNLKPVYAFEHIGSDTLTEVFNGVRSGEDVWAKDVTEAREYYLDKSRKYGYDKWDFKKKYRFESASGDVFELTLDQILSLYAYSKREQAHEHLRLGGFVFDSNIETYKENKHGKSILKYKVNTADAYQITPDILAGIIGTLSQEQASFVDEMQAYLSTTMGAKGNEITMKMYGVKLFKEKFYFPLKSAKQFMFEQNEVSGEVRIKNSGFTNKVVAKANNPVILSNFMDVWSNHVNDMSMYHAFVLPLEDFNRVFNYNSPKQEGQPPVSVKGTIQNAYDPAAVSYVKNLITDLNGGARTDSTTDPINKLMGMFKKGAVFASASVVVQQPSAIARAAAIIDTKYFIGPKVDHKRHKALWDEVKQYAPVAIIKEMGYFDTNMGKSTQDFIQGKEYGGIAEKAKALVTDSGYRDEVLSKAPALADEIAWCAIWEAVKRETMAKNPGMSAKSDAFLKKAGERFTEVIVKTQVYDSVLSRSANMRSKDTGMKMATAFMAEPTTAINMVADALLKGKRNGVEGRRFCRKAIGSVVAAQILNAFLVSWVYAARDDDEEETYAEKYLASFASSVVDGINPATYIPFIKDFVSIVKGYDVERSDMAVISDLWKAWQQLKKDDVSAWRKVEGFVGSICQIFGLPVKNIMRDVRSVYQVYNTMVNGENTTIAGIKYAVNGAVTGKSTPNKEQLYEARMADDKAHTARVEARYGDTDSANAAVRAAIKDRFMEDEIDDATALKQMILYAGMNASEAHWTMDDWKYRKANGSDDGYSKYGRFYDAVRTGKDLKAVVKEYTDYGVKPSTLSGQITERFKPDYVNMSAAERKSIEKYLINAYEMCGMEREDAVAKIESWGWEAEGIEGATQDAIQDYTEWCEPVGIPKATYMTFRKFANSTKNDVDENGKTVNYSAVQKIMAYINDLNLTSAQKDALAKSKGWSDKTISKYKLW